MKIGNFYFIDDQYFIDFPDPNLLGNKKGVSGQAHDRPCFFSFPSGNGKIHWRIPISSKVGKYRAIHKKKVARSGSCDTLVFGNVLGHPKAFLIQNMCPVTVEYINNEYEDSNAVPVRVDGLLEQQLIQAGKKVLALVRKGHHHLIFPDVLSIEKILLANS